MFGDELYVLYVRGLLVWKNYRGGGFKYIKVQYRVRGMSLEGRMRRIVCCGGCLKEGWIELLERVEMADCWVCGAIVC